MKRILFIVHHRLNRSPGQRFRFEQYLQALQEAGFEYEISNILNEDDDKAFYSKGQYLRKFCIMAKSFFHRIDDVRKAKNADIVFIYREAFMLGTIFFEGLLAQTKAKTIFDFDDSIWLNDTSEGNKNLSWLKRPGKTAEIIKLSDRTIVGNSYLAEYAMNYSRNVSIIPTTIDTDYHNPSRKLAGKEHAKSICIGWTGSATTLKHFTDIEPVLARLKDKYRQQVRFKLINNVEYKSCELDIEYCPWTLENEIDDLMDIDIGIMPLPDDKWANGKCGFKGLQYMALEIPTVMSPVGVNTEIIEHGENGFLAKTEEEWFAILSDLIESEQLRRSIGKKGRQTIIDSYSIDSQKEKYVQLFLELAQNN